MQNADNIIQKRNESPLTFKNRIRKLLQNESFQSYVLAAIPILLVIVFSYLPMFGLVIAFKDYKYSQGIFGSAWVGLENFKFLVLSNDFPRITWNTVSMHMLNMFFGTVSGIVVGILLYNLSSRRATKIYQTLMITPNFLSWVVVSYMAFAILHPEHGVLNSIITALGGDAVDWYSKPKAWPAILVTTNTWKKVGMTSIYYYATLMSIDTSLIEACRVEGGNRYHEIRHVMIPHLVPLVVVLTIMTFGDMFRSDFGLFYQVTRNVGALYETTDVLDTYIFRTMRVIGDMGLASAAGLLQSVVGLILVTIVNAIVKRIDPDKSLF